MHPYDDMIDFFVEAMLEQIDNTIREERIQQIIREDQEAETKKAAGNHSVPLIS